VTAIGAVGALGAGLLAFAVLSGSMAAGHPARHAGRPAGATAFSWLTPAPRPSGWPTTRLAGGATLAYPPGWRAVRTDPGTVSVALEQASGLIAGYLNVTPQSGPETLANWTRFRPHHVAAEGARDVRLLASAAHGSFAGGAGSCVLDQYHTSRTGYREVACIVKAGHGTNVVVATAQTSQWQTLAPLLERAVASFAG
jgi:hypothetical protein